MNVRTLALVIIMIILTVLVSGCTDILTKQSVGGFGEVQGNTSTGNMNNGISGSTTNPGNGLQRGSIYTTCYPNCVQYSKKTVAECEQACCMAECQPKTPEDTTRCAASCGVSLTKTPRTYA